MNFLEAIKYIGMGKVVFLKSKPEIFLFSDVHMKTITPELTHPTIVAFNLHTREEKHYYYVEDIKLFTEEEKESDDWIIESAQDIETCKNIINALINPTEISGLINNISELQNNYATTVTTDSLKEKVFHLAINHQLLEAKYALHRVLMYAGLLYELHPKEDN